MNGEQLYRYRGYYPRPNAPERFMTQAMALRVNRWLLNHNYHMRWVRVYGPTSRSLKG